MSNYINRKILGLFVKTNGVFSKPLFSGFGHILCFHRVLPASNAVRIDANSGMEISPEKLEWIIRYFLDKGYEVISMDQLLDFFKGFRKQKRKFIVITFDDGYIDNFLHAYPLLKKLGTPFTIYVCNDFPEKKAVLWWYMLEDYILRNDEVKWVDANGEKIFNASSMEEKGNLFLKIRMLLLERSDAEIRHLLNELMGFSDQTIVDYAHKSTLSWGQINQMASDPLVTIGSHTVSHKPLSKLDHNQAKNEMVYSKKQIEEKIGKEVLHFAYPFGSHNEYGNREIKLAAECEFKTSVTLKQGNIFMSYRNHPHHLPRIPLGEKANADYMDAICKGVRQFSFNGFKKII